MDSFVKSSVYVLEEGKQGWKESEIDSRTEEEKALQQRLENLPEFQIQYDPAPQPDLDTLDAVLQTYEPSNIISKEDYEYLDALEKKKQWETAATKKQEEDALKEFRRAVLDEKTNEEIRTAQEFTESLNARNEDHIPVQVLPRPKLIVKKKATPTAAPTSNTSVPPAKKYRTAQNRGEAEEARATVREGKESTPASDKPVKDVAVEPTNVAGHHIPSFMCLYQSDESDSA